MCGVSINEDSETGVGRTTELPTIDRINARIWHSYRKYFREREITIEDRTWLVLVSDPNIDGSYQQPQIFVPMFGGIIVVIASTIIAVWFHASTTRVARLQQSQATSEMENAALLQNINDELNRQVKQRVEELREKERIAEEKSREAEQAEARSESMIQTMSMLSHELRTPLQVSQTNVGIILVCFKLATLCLKVHSLCFLYLLSGNHGGHHDGTRRRSCQYEKPSRRTTTTTTSIIPACLQP